MLFRSGRLDGVLGIFVVLVLSYGGGEVEGAELLHDVVDGGGEGGLGVEELLLLDCDGGHRIVDTGGGEGTGFNGVTLTVTNYVRPLLKTGTRARDREKPNHVT